MVLVIVVVVVVTSTGTCTSTSTSASTSTRHDGNRLAVIRSTTASRAPLLHSNGCSDSPRQTSSLARMRAHDATILGQCSAHPCAFALGGCAGVLELRRRGHLRRRLLGCACGPSLARPLGHRLNQELANPHRGALRRFYLLSEGVPAGTHLHLATIYSLTKARRA